MAFLSCGPPRQRGRVTVSYFYGFIPSRFFWREKEFNDASKPQVQSFQDVLRGGKVWRQLRIRLPARDSRAWPHTMVRGLRLAPDSTPAEALA